MISKSTAASKTDGSLVAGIFTKRDLANLKEKASKGLWKKTELSWGMECEEYFEQKYLADYLNKGKHPANYVLYIRLKF